MSETEPTTEAFRVQVSFNALTAGDTVHLPVPLDPHNQALVSMGLLVPEGSPAVEVASIISSGQDGDTTTLLGVMPSVASPRRTRGRRSTLETRVAEMETKGSDDGEADS